MTYVQDKNIPFVQSTLSGRSEKPDSTVPRISAWEDLLALLDME
jgi:hypothetical protein